MGLFTDLLFPLKIVQSSSRIKTAGWGERGWNWNDQERKNVTVGLRNRDLVNDACEEFVVARLRMTKRTKWWRHIASRETYHLVFALVDPPRQELPLKIRKTNHLRKYVTKRRKWRDLSSQRVTPLKCFPFLIYPLSTWHDAVDAKFCNGNWNTACDSQKFIWLYSLELFWKVKKKAWNESDVR